MNREWLQLLAAAAEAHGEATMGINDPVACRMFRIRELADDLYLELSADAFTERLVADLTGDVVPA